MNSQLIDNIQPLVSTNWGTEAFKTFEQRSQEPSSVSNEILAGSLLDSLEDQMNTFEQEHLSTVSQLAQIYIFSQDSSVIEFLNSHRTIPQLLISALPHLQTQLGNILFSLRDVADEYGWQSMYVDALWPGRAEDALAAIDRFEDEWWIANSSVAAGRLNFTYRLV